MDMRPGGSSCRPSIGIRGFVSRERREGARGEGGSHLYGSTPRDRWDSKRITPSKCTRGGLVAGRPRKPTALKRLQGTYRPDRESADEPKLEGHADPPDVLTAEALAEWERLAPDLEAIGLLTVADRAVFAVYCQAWADYNRLTDQLNSMASWTWQSAKGYRQQVPEISMRRECWTRLKEAGSRLGLDPSSRSGLHVEPRSKRENKFAELRRLNPFAEFDS